MALFEHGNECVCSYTICVMLVVIVLTISTEIGAYFVFSRWYLKKDVPCDKALLKKVLIINQQFIELINGKSQKNRDQKLNLLFLQRHDQSQKF